MTMEEQEISQVADLPLAGVRVVELVAGPLRLAARLLADLGAQVTRIDLPVSARRESPSRRIATFDLDAARLDRGKTLVADMRLLDELISTADILIEDISILNDDLVPLDLDRLRQTRPELVILSISDFGRTRGFEHWQATDPVLHALSGELARSGLPDHAPLLPPGELAASCAAAQAAYVALLAFWDRLNGSSGNWLDFSILDGAVQTLDPGYGISGSATAGALGSQTSWGRPNVGHRYPVFACADGHVRLCLLAPRQWRGMFAWMGEPVEFADPAFETMAHRFASPALLPAIGRFFAGQTVEAIEQGGQAHGVPVAAVLPPEQAIHTDQVTATDAVSVLQVAGNVQLRMPRGPVLIDGVRPVHAKPGDQHCDAIPRALFDCAGLRKAGERPRPLAGLRVLDLGVIVVGAETGRLLGDAGADVVKVENEAFPDGVRQTRDNSSMSESFAAGQRNKRSLALDLRDPRGKALLLDLVRESDVLLSNFKPGTLASLGLNDEILFAANPRLIAVDSSAFGPHGPASRRLGYGPLVRAASGITDLWTYPGAPDSFSDASTVYPDHVAARYGAMGALALLIRRCRTGRGGTVSIAQAEVILDNLSTEIALAELNRQGVAVQNAEHDAPWDVFPCAGDDAWCAVTVRNDADWARLAPLIGLAEDRSLTTRAARIGARARIDAALIDWLARRSPTEAMTVLQHAGIPAGAMLRVCEQPASDYYVARRFYRTTRHPALPNAIHVEARSVCSEHWSDPEQRDAPVMGQHSGEVLADWLGLSTEQIAALAADRVIGIVAPGPAIPAPHTREKGDA